MHKIKSTFLAIMLSLIAFQTQALTIGEAGPAFDLPGDGASTVKLSSYKGKVIYVDFWASRCGNRARNMGASPAWRTAWAARAAWCLAPLMRWKSAT